MVEGGSMSSEVITEGDVLGGSTSDSSGMPPETRNSSNKS